MSDSTDKAKQPSDDRRQFLRRSIRGSLPLLLGLGETATDEADCRDRAAPAASPPPENSSEAPTAARDELDRRQEEFRSDNPGMTRYPSS
jgi:hypothetical protein